MTHAQVDAAQGERVELELALRGTARRRQRGIGSRSGIDSGYGIRSDGDWPDHHIRFTEVRISRHCMGMPVWDMCCDVLRCGHGRRVGHHAENNITGG